MIKLLLALGGFVLLGGLTQSASAQTGIDARREQLKVFLSQEWEHTMQVAPEFATFVGDNRFNDRLSDYSAEAVAHELEHTRDALKRLEAIDTAGFPKAERLNKELMLRGFRDDLDSAKFKHWEMPVTQFGGPHHEYASLASQTPFHTVKDYENYLARLHQLPRVFEQVTANMRAGMRDHLMPPKYLLEKVTPQVLAIADSPLDASPFTEPIQKFPAEIPEAEQNRLRAAVETTVKTELTPAYHKFAEFVRSEYAPQGRTEPGVWALPDGDERYRYAVRQQTTTDLTPEQIHQLGLNSVTEIEREMLKVAKAQGFKDIQSFNEHIQKDPALHGKSGQQFLDLYTHYKDQMYGKLPELFGRLPKNKLIVTPMESYRSADGVPADYSIGAGDGSRPGKINVNEYAPEKRLWLNVEAIAYHEGVPGHHLQFSIASELTDLPPYRKFGVNYNAYSEGWAFYAERLGKEVGFYQDPYSEYGRLQNEMWRAVRFVVDTGVHSKHWTRQQMLDYFHAHTAMDEQNINTEIDRYIAWPGQALSYKVGQMKILELRARAQKELGSKFDLRSFHDAVLDQGPLPLDVLEAKIEQWIAAQKTSHGG